MKTDIEIHYYDDTYVHVHADISIKMELSDYFCFEIEGAKFNPKVKNGLWDGMIRLFGQRDGALPAGLKSQLIKWASKNKYTLQDFTCNDNELSAEAFDAWLELHRTFDGAKQITPHWYQHDAVLHALQASRCLLQLPTSAGKSLVIALLSKYFLEHNPRKVLVLVPTTALVKQMQEDLINYRLFKSSDILCIKGGTERDSSATVYVSTWQTACKQPIAWFRQFGMLLTDECHLATGMNLSAINKNMVDCKYKIGLSGTLKDAKAHVMQLVGLYGPIFFPVNTSTLMKEGKVTELDIRPIILEYNQLDPKAVKGLTYPEEIKWLITNQKRNKFIARLAASSPDKNTIVLFKELKHGKALVEIINKLIEGTDRKVHYIAGEIKSTVREELRAIIENRSGDIIVASFGTMSTGVSIKNLHRAVCAHPVKSKIINLQSIGRILRKHDSKDTAMWFDLIDDLLVRSKKKRKNYAYEHGVDRLRLYSRENFNYKLSKVNL